VDRIEHPHLAVDGSCGPAGELHGHFHSSCPVEGLTFQCPARRQGGPVCAHVFVVSWDELDALNEARLAEDADSAILLPPCPSCSARTIFSHNDTEYGQDLPEHATMKMIREHVATRPAFKHLQCYPASFVTLRHQGFDFSHLPKKERPEQHRKVDLVAEFAAYTQGYASSEALAEALGSGAAS
jgi:hypothetical protein